KRYDFDHIVIWYVALATYVHKAPALLLGNICRNQKACRCKVKMSHSLQRRNGTFELFLQKTLDKRVHYVQGSKKRRSI
ncbi:MAG: hypothetical protein NTU74_11925, partial [Deltaproteobacteria bacterium]|nr:hypothetical protein [Deltaproteobacteria bacterium]